MNSKQILNFSITSPLFICLSIFANVAKGATSPDTFSVIYEKNMLLNEELYVDPLWNTAEIKTRIPPSFTLEYEPMSGDYLGYDFNGDGFVNRLSNYRAGDTSDTAKKATGGLQTYMSKIEYVFVLMLENRSFDSYFGRLPAYLKKKNSSDPRTEDFYSAVYSTGIDVPDIKDPPFNLDQNGNKIYWKHHSLSDQAKVAAKLGYQGGGLCVSDTAHDWWAAHLQWNSGKMDGFVTSNENYWEAKEPYVGRPGVDPAPPKKPLLLQGERAMLYYDERDIPFFYWLADNFAIGDRYFSSVLGPTWVNRDFLYGATSRGLTSNFSDDYYIDILSEDCIVKNVCPNITAGDQEAIPPVPKINGKSVNYITEALEAKGKTVTYWSNDLTGTNNFETLNPPRIGAWTGDAAIIDSHTRPFGKKFLGSKIVDSGFHVALEEEVKSGGEHKYVSHVNFIDPKINEDVNGEDDHPPGTPINGQKLVYQVVKALKDHPAIWEKSVLFITYDEHGGFYDHVPPPPAVKPDDTYQKWSGPYKSVDRSYYDDDFEHYGMRVPFIVVSPWVKPHYVSHKTYDHTSILRFIEARWGLPAFTKRDANADPMLDMFDFSNINRWLVSLKLPNKNDLKVNATYKDGKLVFDQNTKKLVVQSGKDKYYDAANPVYPTGFVPEICTRWFKPNDPKIESPNEGGLGENVYSSKDYSKGIYYANPPRYEKISNDGTVVIDDAKLGYEPKDWACTRDIQTGLIWEVKTDDGDLRDKDWTYSWYDPNPNTNGGYKGYTNNLPNTDTFQYVKNVNTRGLCGANDWRMPTIEELKGLVSCGHDGQNNNQFCEAVDVSYFPNTKVDYWSSTTSNAAPFNSAWYLHYGYGDLYGGYLQNGKDENLSVRLVRSADRYTKISNDGTVLSNSAQLGSDSKNWACTRDNKTGLIWEVKTDDNTSRDKDWGYYWNDSYNYVNAVNSQKMCGKNTWRLPTKEELLTISPSAYGTGFFEETFASGYLSSYWSSSILDGSVNGVWYVDFKDGTTGFGSNSVYMSHVRTVSF